MTVTNHALLGSIIGISAQKPLVAIPLALLSHYVLDAIPHYGYKEGGIGNALKKPYVKQLSMLDGFGLVVLLIIVRNQPILVFLCIFAAVLPDILNVARYFLLEKNHKKYTKDPYSRFHSWIQWCERPWGICIEVVMMAILSLVLKAKL